MCSSLDIKDRDNLDVVLNKIKSEIASLETEGLEIATENGPVTVYGTLAQFTGDNLGMNQILGFIESFSCDFCCLLCYATRADMQIKFREAEFTLRTHDAYERDLFDLAKMNESTLMQSIFVV